MTLNDFLDVKGVWHKRANCWQFARAPRATQDIVIRLTGNSSVPDTWYYMDGKTRKYIGGTVRLKKGSIFPVNTDRYLSLAELDEEATQKLVKKDKKDDDAKDAADKKATAKDAGA